MEFVLSTLVAKLLSPLIIMFSFVVGLLALKWVHVAIGAIIVALIQEGALHQMQLTRSFEPSVFLIGVAAAALWCVVVFQVKLWLEARRRRP